MLKYIGKGSGPIEQKTGILLYPGVKYISKLIDSPDHLFADLYACQINDFLIIHLMSPNGCTFCVTYHRKEGDRWLSSSSLHLFPLHELKEIHNYYFASPAELDMIEIALKYLHCSLPIRRFVL